MITPDKGIYKNKQYEREKRERCEGEKKGYKSNTNKGNTEKIRKKYITERTQTTTK